jgi:hypothetical protein
MSLSRSPKPIRAILVPKAAGDLLNRRKSASIPESNITVDTRLQAA